MTSKGFKIKFSIYRQQSISNCQDIIESDYLPFFHLVCFKRHSCTIAFNKSLFCIVRVDKKYLMNNQMCFSIINKFKKKSNIVGTYTIQTVVILFSCDENEQSPSYNTFKFIFVISSCFTFRKFRFFLIIFSIAVFLVMLCRRCVCLKNLKNNKNYYLMKTQNLFTCYTMNIIYTKF